MSNVNLANVDFQQQAAAKSLGIDLPPEDQTKVRIRIKSRTSRQVVCGTTVDYGEHTYLVYKAYVPEFEKLVEMASPAERQQAQRMFELDQRSAEGQRDGVEGAEYRKQYDPSYPAAFRSLFGRDLLPFDLVEIEKPVETKAHKGT
jgi:hypothetical protein